MLFVDVVYILSSTDIESKLRRIEEDPEGSGTSHLFNCIQGVSSLANRAFQPLFERQVCDTYFSVDCLRLWNWDGLILICLLNDFCRIKLRRLGQFKECYRGSEPSSTYLVPYVGALARENMTWQLENTRRRNRLLCHHMYTTIYICS